MSDADESQQIRTASVRNPPIAITDNHLDEWERHARVNGNIRPAIALALIDEIRRYRANPLWNVRSTGPTCRRWRWMSGACCGEPRPPEGERMSEGNENFRANEEVFPPCTCVWHCTCKTMPRCPQCGAPGPLVRTWGDANSAGNMRHFCDPYRLMPTPQTEEK